MFVFSFWGRVKGQCKRICVHVFLLLKKATLTHNYQ